ncbi:ankyrin repeat-containing domain protein [Hypomontagnella submonticulosa]|nr:ankyrin repeat-containing domain protein [Hypomontagnella submonticulosa]
MSDSSDAVSDSSSSADTSSQKDPIEDIARGSPKDDPDKDEASSRKGAADDHETTSRNGDSDANESGRGSQKDTGDGDDIVPVVDFSPWYELLEYMDNTKSPEYGAEGLVTLWDVQDNDHNSGSADYMAADFDIVVVHGLRGSRRPPWKSPGSGSSLWLYDQGAAGRRKVMSFGYDGSKLLCGSYTRQTIRNVASSLLEELSAARNGNQRPIMFIAHDIGGIIVKDALTMAGLNLQSYGEIFDFTRVLIFYGCPHRALDALDMEDKLARFIYRHPSSEGPALPQLTSSMKYLSEAVIAINNLFMDSKQMFRSYIISMVAENDTSLIDEVFDSFTGTMGVPFEIRLPGGSEDDRSLIEKKIGLIDSLIRADKESLDNERSLLSAASPLLPLKTTAAPDHPYSWIRDHGVYKSWYNQRKPQLLYLHGESGTRLASESIFYDLDSLHSDRNGQIVLYFTFDRYDVRRDDIRDMLATFLVQLLGHFPTLSRQFNDQFEHQRADRSWNYIDLLHWFEYYRIFGEIEGISCVINHLDECEPVSRKVFLNQFRYVSGTQERPWRVLVTSRQPGALLEELANWPILDLSQSNPDIDQDAVTDSYRLSLLRERPEVRGCKTQFEEQLKAIATLEPEVRELVISHVSRNEQWPARQSVSDILGPMEGRSLESVVWKILSNVPERSLAFHALTWILYAVRPPTIWELTTAVMIGLGKDSSDDLLPTVPLANQLLCKLRTWLAGIVTLEHNEVAITTNRIREVLMTKSSSEPEVSHFWDVMSRDAHYNIAKTCLTFLTSAVAKENMGRLYDNSHYNNIHLALICDRTSLLDYAVEFWVHHLSLVSADSDMKKDIGSFVESGAVSSWTKAQWVLANPLTRSKEPFKCLYPVLAGVGLAGLAENWRDGEDDLSAGLIEACLNGSSQTVRHLLPRRKYSVETLNEALTGAGAYGDETAWIEVIDYIKENYPEFPWETRGTIVSRASWLGLSKALTRLIEVGCPVDAEDPARSFPMTPLRLATRTGNLETAKVLLKHGANPNHNGSFKSTPLHLAATYGHAEMIKLLAKHGADLNAKDEDLATPLYDASLWAKDKAVKALVDLKADVNLKTVENQEEVGWSPLGCAAEEGNAECVRYLLEGGANPEIVGFLGTPLRYAASNGSVEICELLLNKGVNPNHESLMPPILVAATSSTKSDDRLGVVKLLVEKEARVNAVDANENTALYWTCWSDDPDRHAIAEYLLQHGADVNCQGLDGALPIHIAVTRNDVEMLRILLEQSEIELDRLDKGKSTGLVLAIKSEEMTRMLLEKGANPNIRPDGEDPVVMHAVWGDHTEVVRLLIQHGAQIDPPDELRNDSTWEPMENAVVWGRSDIVRVLADGGADVNRKFGDGRTLVHKGLDKDAIGALLEFRPKLDVKGNDGDAPLHEITDETPLENIKLLVRAGVEINTTNDWGLTYITQAARSNHDEAVRYFISKKADLNIAAPTYGGPLHVSCSLGKVDLAKELISAGANVNLVVSGQAGSPLSAIFVGFNATWASEETVTELINILIEAGANIKAGGGIFGTVAGSAALGGYPAHIDLLASKGVSFASADDMGRRPLHFAAVRGQKDIVAAILNTDRVAPTAKDTGGRNAVSWAAQGGDTEVLSDLLEVCSDEAINEPDLDGWTPLFWAARGVGNRIKFVGGLQYDMIKALLKRGADRSVKSRVGGREYTPALLAAYHSSSDDVIELLTTGKDRYELPDGEDGDSSPDPEEHHDTKPTSTNQKVFAYSNAYCDYCLYTTYGLRYTCKTCSDFCFCFKCYQSRDHIHSADHEFDEVGPEFIDVFPPPRSRSSSPAQSTTETASTSASDSDDDDKDSDKGKDE